MSGAANVTIAVPAALGAAASFGLGAAVQHRQARLTPAAVPTRGERAGALRLLARLARQPLWLAGIALTIAGYGLQATALAFGPLTLVAPIVAADLMFALPVAARWARRPLTSRDWLGCVLTAGGIGVFLVTAPESSGRSDAPAQDWLLAFGAVALICVAVTALGRRLRSRAVTTAVAAGLIYGLTAAVTLSLTRLARAEGPWRALAHWQPWALAGLGLAGLALTMGAFQAGALGASLPVIDTVEPLCAVLLGTVIFGERLAASPAGLASQLAGAAVAAAGIVVLGRSPLAARAYSQPAGERRLSSGPPGPSPRPSLHATPQPRPACRNPQGKEVSHGERYGSAPHLFHSRRRHDPSDSLDRHGALGQRPSFRRQPRGSQPR
jgi:drug/metabolite transporter (DMT)-like permease